MSQVARRRHSTTCTTVSQHQNTATGRLQPTAVRKKPHPEVCFNKGGSDFRCPRTFSCFGRQALSRDIYRTAGTPAFARQDRWYVPGDKFKGERREGQSYRSGKSSRVMQPPFLYTIFSSTVPEKAFGAASKSIGYRTPHSDFGMSRSAHLPSADSTTVSLKYSWST